MKMKSALFGSTVLACVFLSGCAAVGTRNGVGVIYTDAKDGIAVGPQGSATKMGEACATNILGLVSTGDMSIDAAKRAGGITKVSTADYSQSSILGIYSKTCAIVRGE